MTRRWAALLAAAVLSSSMMAIPANAADPEPPEVDAGTNTFDAYGTTSDEMVPPDLGGGGSPASNSPYVSYDRDLFCSRDPDINVIETCRGPERCGEQDRGRAYRVYGVTSDGRRDRLATICDEPGDVTPAQPRLTLAMVANAFRRVPLPDSVIDIQPPGGRTLVNLPTIMSTQSAAFTETVRLLGRTVTLEITPAAYRWVHGDGTSTTTDTPGVPYIEARPMSDYLTHAYLREAEDLSARVDTTWTATFRVDGGPSQPVPGSVTIEGSPTPLDVVEADPILVGYGQ